MSSNSVSARRLNRRQFLLLVVIGILSAIILIEIVGRVLRRLPVPPPDSYYALVETLGEYPKPYEHFTYTSPVEGEFSNFIQFNYRGLRDIDHDYALPDTNTTRILFLGDSFTAGWEVAQDQTYPAQLRTILNEQIGIQQYDIINAGLHAWGTDRQYLYYREEGVKYNSDIVILQVYAGNDVTDNGISVLQYDTFADNITIFNRTPIDETRPYFLLDEIGNLEYVPPENPLQPETKPRTLPGQVRAFLEQNSFTYQLINNVLSQIQSTETTTSDQPEPDLPDSWAWLRYTPYAPEFETDPNWNIAWDITEKLILELKKEVEANGGVFAVLLVHSSWENDPEGWQQRLVERGLPDTWEPTRPSERFIQFFEHEEIPYFDTFPVLKMYETAYDTSLHYEHDGHWNAIGHCVVAVEIQNWLMGGGGILESPNYQALSPTEMCP